MLSTYTHSNTHAHTSPPPPPPDLMVLFCCAFHSVEALNRLPWWATQGPRCLRAAAVLSQGAQEILCKAPCLWLSQEAITARPGTGVQGRSTVSCDSSTSQLLPGCEEAAEASAKPLRNLRSIPQASEREAEPRQCGQGPHVSGFTSSLAKDWRCPEEVRHLARPLLTLRESCQLENSGRDSDRQGEADSTPTTTTNSHYGVIIINASICPTAGRKGKYLLHSELCQLSEH